MAFNSTRADITKPQDIFKKVTALLVVTSDQASGRTAAERNRDELESLCTTLGIRAAAWDFFNVRTFNSATYLGSGQVQRLAYIAEENQCNLIVFNNSISPRIQRNLEEILDIAVVDRQEIILQIFADRATTREARLQVELAQLQYSLPRLKRKWADLSQQRGGVKGSKGSGEKQLELDRRTAQARIVRLKREIEQIGKSRDTQRKNRTSGNVKNVAIVGYTNSGKSTLLNRISDASVLSEDKLFATLDPTTRRVHLPGGETALFTDTVGFVSDLPHELVDAFRSTLEEAVLADVLLIVVDASRDDFLMCWETTKSVLEDLGAFDK
ncbi:MAG: GTPase HflX, partial [Spirochaetales bacterium]|nr:GTPase HflX [Spirochaetales bacterium]